MFKAIPHLLLIPLLILSCSGNKNKGAEIKEAEHETNQTKGIADEKAGDLIFQEPSPAPVKRFVILSGRNDEVTRVDSATKANTRLVISTYNPNDFLTPVPTLYDFKNRLIQYKANGVKGAFLQDPGRNYSTFNDMKTSVVAALLDDPSLPVDSLCTLYFNRNYPVAGKLLANYYLSLERREWKQSKPFPKDGNFGQAINAYLDAHEFVTFYEELGRIKEEATSPERQKLDELYTALAFTRMQIAYYRTAEPYGFANSKSQRLSMKGEVKTWFAQLAKHSEYDDLANYREAGGKLDTYLANWQYMLQTIFFQNLLMGEQITALSQLDDDYQRTEMLCDGVTGFEGDYHQGWMISSKGNPCFEFPAKRIKQAQRLTMRFLVSEKDSIFAPEKMVIYRDNQPYLDIGRDNKDYHTRNGFAEISSQVDFSKAQSVSIKFFREPAGGRLAFDEVQVTD